MVANHQVTLGALILDKNLTMELNKSDFRIAEFNDKFTIERKDTETKGFWLIFWWWKKEVEIWKKVDSEGVCIYHIHLHGTGKSYSNEDNPMREFSTLNSAKHKVEEIIKFSKMKTIYHEI